jgi:hypothetical protein
MGSRRGVLRTEGAIIHCHLVAHLKSVLTDRGPVTTRADASVDYFPSANDVTIYANAYV